VSPAFAYQGSYSPNAKLSFGEGYWLRMNGARLITIYGDDIENRTLPLTSGWNLIGGLSLPVGTTTVSTVPPAQIASRFFGYASGYTVADSLRPMHGYWVKVKSDCGLVLAAIPSAAKASPSPLKQLDRLTIADKNGGEQSLYFGTNRDID